MLAKWSWGASGVLVSETWLTTGLPQLDGHRYDGGDAVLARIALFPHVGQQRWPIQIPWNVITFAQDVNELCTLLPRLLENLDVLIIRKQGVRDSSTYKDFHVRKSKVLRLRFQDCSQWPH